MPCFVECLTKWPEHGTGADIFTANMYLVEGRIRGESDVNVVGLRFSYALIDPILGTGVEARRRIGSSLRRVGLRQYGHTGSGARRSVLE